MILLGSLSVLYIRSYITALLVPLISQALRVFLRRGKTPGGRVLRSICYEYAESLMSSSRSRPDQDVLWREAFEVLI